MIELGCGGGGWRRRWWRRTAKEDAGGKTRSCCFCYYTVGGSLRYQTAQKVSQNLLSLSMTGRFGRGITTLGSLQYILRLTSFSRNVPYTMYICRCGALSRPLFPFRRRSSLLFLSWHPVRLQPAFFRPPSLHTRTTTYTTSLARRNGRV